MGDDDDLSAAERILKNLAICVYFFNNFDPFAIYKANNCKQQQWRRRTSSTNSGQCPWFLSKELRIESKEIDRKRHRFRVVILFLYLILIVRFTTIGIVQLAKYRATTYFSSSATKALEPSSIVQLPIIEETQPIVWLKKLYLYDLSGSILSDFHGGALFVYVFVVASISYSVYYLPRYYSLKPADTADLRMAFDPVRERRRMDLLLRRHAEQLLLVTEIYRESRARMAGELRTTSRLPRIKHPDDAEIRSISESIRPAQYKLGHRRYWRGVKKHFLPVTVLCSSFGLRIQMYLIYFTIDLRCKLKQLLADECTMLNAFTRAEIYSFVELMVAIYWMGTILVTTILTILTQLDLQLQSISETEDDMRTLLEILRYYNVWAPGIYSTIGRKSNREPCPNVALIKGLAKTSFQLDEMRGRASFISEQASALVVLCCAGIVPALTAVRMEGPDMEGLRAIIIGCLWLASNLLLIVCARQYANLIRLERVGWPIAAQLIVKLGQNWNKRPYNRLRLDPLTRGWLKLLETGSFIDESNSIRPFGVTLTFKRVLQMNFYVTSLAVLVLR